MNKNDLGNNEIFARNLKRYLRKDGRSQREIAKALGISKSTLCDWANGRAYPKMDKVQMLAEYFGIKKSDLIEDVNVTKETVSEKEQILLDLFHQVPEEDRDYLLGLIEFHVKNRK